jgi:hypothetical protein
MKTTDEIRRHLALLKDQAKARAARWGYAADASMPDGWGLTKYDCGLILTSLGQFLGYRVYGKQVFGKADWGGIVLPGQLSPAVDGPEIRITYLDRKRSSADYTWFDGERCVGVFETDGRPNSRSRHLPATDPVEIRPHARSTNNLFKLSVPVLQDYFGYVPGSRAWILFQVSTEVKQFSPWGKWGSSIEEWRSGFSQCANLNGAIVIRDTELFGELFVEHVHGCNTFGKVV